MVQRDPRQGATVTTMNAINTGTRVCVHEEWTRLVVTSEPDDREAHIRSLGGVQPSSTSIIRAESCDDTKGSSSLGDVGFTGELGGGEEDEGDEQEEEDGG